MVYNNDQFLPEAKKFLLSMTKIYQNYLSLLTFKIIIDPFLQLLPEVNNVLDHKRPIFALVT